MCRKALRRVGLLSHKKTAEASKNLKSKNILKKRLTPGDAIESKGYTNFRFFDVHTFMSGGCREDTEKTLDEGERLNMKTQT